MSNGSNRALTPAQGRLARLLREQGDHIVGLPVTGFAFGEPATAAAWGKGLRSDTVAALVAAGVLAEYKERGGRRRYCLVQQG